MNDGIQTIAKLWGKHPFHRFTIVAAMVLFGKAHAVATDAISADVGGHDQYHLFKAWCATVIVSERAMIHHLEQQVKYIRMGFFNLI